MEPILALLAKVLAEIEADAAIVGLALGDWVVNHPVITIAAGVVALVAVLRWVFGGE
jgi:hypothetical protein